MCLIKHHNVYARNGQCNVSVQRFEQLNHLKYKQELSEQDIKDYINFIFYSKFGYNIDWDNPITYNEKLNWLKVYYHNPVMHIIADKAKFHAYLLAKLPGFEKHCVKPLVIFHSPEEFSDNVLEQLPEKFFIKSNFGSGAQKLVEKRFGVMADLRKLMEKWLMPSSNHYYYALEYCYKDIVPAVVCEAVIVYDYNIQLFCFGGTPLMYKVKLNDKTKDAQDNFYGMDGRLLPVSWHHPNFAGHLSKPSYFNELVVIAGILSAGFPHVRVDFYGGRDTWHFNEMTFFTWAGLMPFSDFAFDIMLGQKIDLVRMETKCV